MRTKQVEGVLRLDVVGSGSTAGRVSRVRTVWEDFLNGRCFAT